MSDEAQTILNPKFLEAAAQYLFDVVQPELFDARRGDPNPPPPEEEIRTALRENGGFIRLRDDKNSYLVISNRNDGLLVHIAHIRAVIHQAALVSHLWDDSAEVDENSRLIGLDAVGLLVELESGKDSVKDICVMMSVDVVMDAAALVQAKVTVLDMKRIDLHTFLEGLEAGAAVPIEA